MVIVILQWLVRFVLPAVVPDTTAIGVFGGVIGGLAIVVWWAFFSRAPRFERWTAIVLMIVALAATSQILDKSIETAMMGMMFTVYSIPVLSLAFVVWAVASRNLSNGPRRCNYGRYNRPCIRILGVPSYKWNDWRSSSVFFLAVGENSRGEAYGPD